MKQQYKKIKTKALLDSRIICQVVVDRTLQRKGNQSIATKLLLQIIAKRGNTLWVPKGQAKFDNVMIMAFDVAKCRNSYIMSVVATVNSTFTSIFSKTADFKNSNDRFQPMFTLYVKALMSYMDRNKCFPKEVIIMHNAVPFDQISLLRDHFIDQCLKNDYNGVPPSLTFVMVNTKND